MSVSFSGTWMATLPRQNAQTKLIFSSTNSAVQIQPVGAAAQNFMTGIYAEDGNGNFVIQATPPPQWDYPYNYVWSGTHNADSGSGFHVEYSHTRQLASLEPATFAKVN